MIDGYFIRSILATVLVYLLIILVLVGMIATFGLKGLFLIVLIVSGLLVFFYRGAS